MKRSPSLNPVSQLWGERRDCSSQLRQVRNTSWRETVRKVVWGLRFHLPTTVSYLLLYCSSALKGYKSLTWSACYPRTFAQNFKMRVPNYGPVSPQQYYSLLRLQLLFLPHSITRRKKAGTVQFAAFYKRWMVLRKQAECCSFSFFPTLKKGVPWKSTKCNICSWEDTPVLNCWS